MILMPVLIAQLMSARTPSDQVVDVLQQAGRSMNAQQLWNALPCINSRDLLSSELSRLCRSGRIIKILRPVGKKTEIAYTLPTKKHNH